jgi:hypothetical protein
MMLFSGAMLLGGCQETKQRLKDDEHAFYLDKHHIPPPEPLNPTVVYGDQAMSLRQWEPSPTFFINDAVIAGPTYTPLKVGQMRGSANAIVEPALFFANTLYTPFGCFFIPPWTDIVYKSLTTEPSHTLMPPLPKGAETVPSYYYNY